jgi:hypothetical protein
MQRDLIGAILGETIAEAWYTLVTRREFVHKEQRGIVYAAGQPMGALSSWGVFALSHHLTVQMAAISAGASSNGKWFTKYVMIGDDIAIFNRKVAGRYREILTSLGVPFNIAKSLAPPPKGVGAVEIAKRTFTSGIEISPCPPDIILAAKGDANIFPVLLQVSLDRDIVSPNDRSSVMSLLTTWYPPSVVEAVELVLYDPRESRALLKAGDPSETPWEGMSEADVATEVDYVFLRRIKDKALNLAGRLRKAEKSKKVVGQGHEPTHLNGSITQPQASSLPTHMLQDRLRLVAKT